METQEPSDLAPECLTEANDRPNYLIAGDSLAADMYSVFRTAFPRANFLQVTAGNCRPLLDLSTYLRQLFGEIERLKRMDGVILHGCWAPDDIPGLLKTVEHLIRQGVRVLVIGAGVRFQQTPERLILQAKSFSLAEIEAFAYKNRWAFDGVNIEIARQLPSGVNFIDLETLFLAGGKRLFTPVGAPIFIDNFHLTYEGARYVSELLRNIAIADTIDSIKLGHNPVGQIVPRSAADILVPTDRDK